MKMMDDSPETRIRHAYSGIDMVQNAILVDICQQAHHLDDHGTIWLRAGCSLFEMCAALNCIAVHNIVSFCKVHDN